MLEQTPSQPYGEADTVPSKSSARKIIVGAGIGNALEWYDFSIYAIFAPFFAHQFFYRDDPRAALLASLAVFAVGFLFRPIGGIFFGWLADRKGRRYAMLASMVLTAVGSLIIAIAPPYASIGLSAPVLLVLGRLTQGFGLGGEIGASFTFLVESAPPKHRGLWASSMFVAVSCGALSAAGAGLLLTSVFDGDAMQSYGWRIPFAAGALLGLYALYLRRGLDETRVFREEVAEVHQCERQTMWHGLWINRLAVLQVVGLTAGASLVYHTWISGISNYAIRFKQMSAPAALGALTIGIVIYMIAHPIWGHISDRYGRRPNLLVFGFGSAILIVPLLNLIQGEFWQLTLSISVALVFLAAWTSICPAVFAELFPTQVRASGVAISYSFTVATFGGTAPYLQTYWADQNKIGWFAAYVVIVSLLTVVTVMFMPETRDRPLT
jgi:MHS family alpha-ketoglutarate permease-like MFS transporter